MKKNMMYNLMVVPMLLFLAIFSGCGKNQATGGTFGAATGAILGAAVAGPHDTGTGVAIGALAGSLLGSSVGQSADEEEAEQQTAVREMHHRQREARLEEENRRLRDKWCVGCGNHVTLEGAKSCPQCGGELIREKYCKSCTTQFSPRTGYKFCPYCKQQTPLVGR